VTFNYFALEHGDLRGKQYFASPDGNLGLRSPTRVVGHNKDRNPLDTLDTVTSRA